MTRSHPCRSGQVGKVALPVQGTTPLLSLDKAKQPDNLHIGTASLQSGNDNAGRQGNANHLQDKGHSLAWSYRPCAARNVARLATPRPSHQPFKKIE